MNKEVNRAKKNALQRKGRIRSKVVGSAERPRLTVFISNYHISAQLINDDSSTTIAAASSVGKKMSGNMSDKAIKIGQEIAKNGKAKKIELVVLDRNGKKYHGRLKAFAEAAREGGLKF